MTNETPKQYQYSIIVGSYGMPFDDDVVQNEIARLKLDLNKCKITCTNSGWKLEYNDDSINENLAAVITGAILGALNSLLKKAPKKEGWSTGNRGELGNIDAAGLSREHSAVTPTTSIGPTPKADNPNLL